MHKWNPPQSPLNLVQEPYFGDEWGTAINEIEDAYTRLIDCIQTAGFALGGLVFNAELTKREQRTNNLVSAKSVKK